MSKPGQWNVEQEIRARSLDAAVQRFKNMPAASCPPELVVASADIYAKFILGGSAGNSEKESAGKPGDGLQP